MNSISPVRVTTLVQQRKSLTAVTDPDQTANTPIVEYWGQGGCQHKAQKSLSHL